MKKTFYLPFISLSLLLLGCGLFWFKNIFSAPVNQDEVAWVLDARFYQFRQQKQWEKFVLTDHSLTMSWSHDQYRLIDQPQLGKYIYGLVIKFFNLNPWDTDQSIFLYRQFAIGKLNLGSLNTIKEYPDLRDSIYILRIFGSIVSFISIAFFGIEIYFLTKSKITGGLTSVLLFFHPTLYFLYRLAVPNNFQVLLTILALNLMFYLLNRIKTLGLKKKVLWVLLGVLIACSTSIKLNGFLILAFPILLWLIQEIKALFSQEEIIPNIFNKLRAYLFLVGSFIATFHFLEPELWGQPLRGLRLLFTARLVQHRRFLIFFEDYSFFETIWFLLIQFLKISNLLVIKIFFVLLLLRGIIIIFDKLSDLCWFNLGLLILLVVVSNTYYANVGFDRYAEWSIYVFSFLSALGAVDFFRIFYNKIKQLW